MSTKLAQLREQRNVKARAANELSNKYPADQRMPKAEIEKLDAILNEIADIDSEIEREQRRADLAGQEAGQLENELRNRHTRTPGAQSNGASGLRNYMRGGFAALSDEQRSEHRARQTPDIVAAYQGVGNPQAAMSTTTPAEGGYTTAPETQTSLEVAMRAYGAIFDAVDTIRTATGNDMPFPTADATLEEGEIVGQNAATNSGDTTFGTAGIAVYRYSSKKIALPWELVQDSFIDIESYIQDLLAMRLGRIRSKHLTIGSGTNQPFGIVPRAQLGKLGATGKTTTVDYDDLIDLEHSVDPIYRAMPGVGWMFHDNTLAKVRKLKDLEGRPIFNPGYESGNPGTAPDRLLGRPITINQDMATMSANAVSILYGAFKKYKQRQVMDLTLFRFTDSAFTLNGQIGFCAFQRCGGNLIDAGGAIKGYKNSAT